MQKYIKLELFTIINKLLSTGKYTILLSELKNNIEKIPTIKLSDEIANLSPNNISYFLNILNDASIIYNIINHLSTELNIYHIINEQSIADTCDKYIKEFNKSIIINDNIMNKKNYLTAATIIYNLCGNNNLNFRIIHLSTVLNADNKKQYLLDYNILQSILYIPKMIYINDNKIEANKNADADIDINEYVDVDNINSNINKNANKNINKLNIITFNNKIKYNIYALLSNNINKLTGINKTIIKSLISIELNASNNNMVDLRKSSNLCDEFVNMNFGYSDIVLRGAKGSKSNMFFSGNKPAKKYNIVQNNILIDKKSSRNINKNILTSLILKKFNEIDNINIDVDLFIILTPDDNNNYLFDAVKEYYISECIIDCKNSDIKKIWNEIYPIYYVYSLIIIKRIYAIIRNEIFKDSKETKNTILKNSLNIFFKDPVEIIKYNGVVNSILNL